MQNTVQNHTTVAGFLRYRLAYPESPNRVDVIETQLSWVFLTSRFVYKLKKPVKFDFLDFSTHERRKQACEDEIRINRRLSPDVYLAVVPVTQSSRGSFSLGGEGRPVDWVVKMRRLDDARTLEAMIRRDELTDADKKKLGQWLADFYIGQAPVTLRTSDYRRQLAQHIESSERDVANCLPREQDAIRFVASAQARFLRVFASDFDDRVCDGRIVDGHGDLRPEHIFLEQQPRVVDCIEFNEEFRRNDILDELGLLAMECDRIGAISVGQQILEIYQSLGHDRPPPELIEFYMCYRAFFRAKVAAMRIEHMNAVAHAAAADEAQSYLRLALHYAKSCCPRLLVMVGGLMVTGKSTLAKEIATELCAELLQTDAIRSEVAGSQGAASDSGEGKDEAAERLGVYQSMCEQSERCFTRTATVVLDGTFSSHKTRQLAVSCAKHVGARVVQIQCSCPRRVALQRMAERLKCGDSALEARLEIYERQAAEYQRPLSGIPICTVKTTEPLTAQVERVVKQIRSLLR